MIEGLIWLSTSCVICGIFGLFAYILERIYVKRREKAKKHEQNKRRIYEDRRKRNIIQEANMWYDVYSVLDYMK